MKSRYRFDSLIETEGMRVAKGVCLGIAKSGKTVLNPVYIYGAPGCGKTHLLQATCTAAIEDDRNTVYLTGEAFLNFLSEHRGTASNATKLLQESADILCVDDIPFLESHPRSSAVLADLIHRFVDAKKPVLLAGQWKPARVKQAVASLYRVIRKGVVLHIGDLKEDEKGLVAEELAKRFSLLGNLSHSYRTCHTVGEILSLLLQTDEKNTQMADLMGALTQRIVSLFGEDAPVVEISFYALRKLLGLREAKRIVLKAEAARVATLSRKARTFIEKNSQRRNKFHQLLRFLEQQCKSR
ncbi:MAG: hypothetical protein DRP63_03995 [Planctomycetota bacterium]|nr:MAG: hypothetical protein DRP63_03995 [Planctomycetota bacterium]